MYKQIEPGFTFCTVTLCGSIRLSSFFLFLSR